MVCNPAIPLPATHLPMDGYNTMVQHINEGLVSGLAFTGEGGT